MPRHPPEFDEYIPAPTLRRKMGIAAVTLWRWRQRPDFPRPIRIHNRNYFRRASVAAWLAKVEKTAGQ